MSIVMVELTVPSDSFAIGTILQDHEDVRIELAQFVPIGEALIPYFWVETDDTPSFEEAVRADHCVGSLTALDSSGDRTLYRIDWVEPIDGFLSAVVDHGLLIESATGTDECWQFRLQGPDRENLSAFRETLRERDVPVTIRRVWNPKVTNEDRYELTTKQRETLELAFEAGYFEVPRDASLTDLGEMLDISHQSVSRRLRGGLTNLLATTLMDEPDADTDTEERSEPIDA